MYRKQFILAAILATAILYACSGKDNPAGPSTADRDKFVGKWAGTYQCTNLPGDTLIISVGSGNSGLNIILHASSSISNPEIVNGELSDVNVITIPEQEIGGFPGSGKITYANSQLKLEQTGLGITCMGSNYAKY